MTMRSRQGRAQAQTKDVTSSPKDRIRSVHELSNARQPLQTARARQEVHPKTRHRRSSCNWMVGKAGMPHCPQALLCMATPNAPGVECAVGLRAVRSTCVHMPSRQKTGTKALAHAASPGAAAGESVAAKSAAQPSVAEPAVESQPKAPAAAAPPAAGAAVAGPGCKGQVAAAAAPPAWAALISTSAQVGRHLHQCITARTHVPTVQRTVTWSLESSRVRAAERELAPLGSGASRLEGSLAATHLLL